MPRHNDKVEIEGKIQRQTAKAICFKMHLPDNEELHETDQWIPLSQIEEIHPGEDSKLDTLVVTAWIAKEKGFIEK